MSDELKEVIRKVEEYLYRSEGRETIPLMDSYLRREDIEVLLKAVKDKS